MSHAYRPGALAFPLLPAVIYRLEETDHTGIVPALVDTGADGTLVPIRLLLSIRADRLHHARIHSHWGESRSVVLYLVDLEIAGERMPAVEVVADDQGDDLLLGRNVLNQLILLLDGPGHKTDLLMRRPRRI